MYSATSRLQSVTAVASSEHPLSIDRWILVSSKCSDHKDVDEPILDVEEEKLEFEKPGPEQFLGITCFRDIPMSRMRISTT